MTFNKAAALLVAVLVLCSGGFAQTTYVYTGNYGSNSVSGFSVNRVTGTLTPLPNSPFPAGSNPGYVAIDRQCRFGYVSNFSSQNVSAYSIDTNNGNLIPVLGSPFAASDAVPAYSWIDQFGNFLLVPMQGSGGNGTLVSVFAIDGDTGILTQVAGSPFSTGGVSPDSVTVDPSNRFVYVANTSSNSVSGFTLDPNTGTLAQIPGSPWPTSGSRPIVVRTDNTGRFAYVTNRSSIAMFTIDQTTGALNPISGSPLPVGFDLYFMAFDVTNKYMYVADNNDAVYGYLIDPSTGALNPLPGFPVTTDSPQGNAVFAVDPSGGLLYIAGFGGSNTVSTWKVDSSTGALSQLSRVQAGSYPASIGVCTADAEGALARVVGNNTYDGNQTVVGNVTATAFFGNGSNLSGVITGVTAGSGLLGGGTSGSVNLSVNRSVVAFQSDLASDVNSAETFAISAATTAQNNAISYANGTFLPLAGGTLTGRLNGTVANFGGDVTAAGNVTASRNVSAGDSVTIGTGGTPIAEYVSTTYSATLPILSSGACAMLTTAALTGFTPGTADTIALGIPKSLVSSLGNNVFLIYQAWETTTSASPTITIQVCNPTGSRYSGGATGTIRVDIFKH
jgi:6-phosphogluconolactonase (cycloisomerase 2 family)